MGRNELRGSARPLFPNRSDKRIRKEVQLESLGAVPTVVYGSIEEGTKPKRKRVDTTKQNLSSTKAQNKKAINGDDDLEEEETSYIQLLRKNRPFRLYIMSYIANHMGEWLTYLASISAIEEIQLAQGRRTTSRTAISALIIIRLAPNIILSPFGGIVADCLDRRKSMISLDLLAALVALLFILAVERQSISLIYLATFLQECVAGLYEPSRSAIIPLLVPEEEEMKKATTMAELAWSVVAAFGSATCGFLVTLLGLRACYFVDSLTYLLSAYLMSLVGGKWNVASSGPSESVWATIEGMFCDGVKYLRSSFFGALAFLKFSAALIYGAMDVLNVSFSERGDLEGRSNRLGLLFAAVGIGCLVGPLIADRYTDMSCPKTLQLACLYSILLIGVGSLFMGLFSAFWIICALSGIRSMGQSIVWIDSSLLLQKFSDPELLGRVSAADYALALLAESLSAVAAGILQDHGGYTAEQVSLILGGFGLLLWAIWMYYHYCGGGAASYIDEEASGTSAKSTGTQTTETSSLMMSDDQDS